MSISSGQQGPLYLGIDGGGSKCRVVLVTADNQLLGEGLGGPANPLRGMKVATDSILTATQQALTAAGMTFNDMARLVVGAGLAGVNMPQYFKLFSEWKHPFAEFHLTSDLHIACIGAHDGADGAVIIAGTGSCGLADVKGQLLDIGGHGFPYGDNGSGAWFGMQLVHQVLLSKDQLQAPTLLSDLLAEAIRTNATLEIVSHFMHATPTIYAKYAPLVFTAAEQGDATALQIVHQGAAFINQIALKLFELQPPRFSMIGGLAYKLVPYLDEQVQRRLTPALAAPEFGAIWYARQQQALLNSAKTAIVN
jgi:glucosamine kinase